MTLASDLDATGVVVEGERAAVCVQNSIGQKRVPGLPYFHVRS